MKRIFRWVLILVAALVLGVVALVAYVFIASNRLMARTYVVDVPRITVASDPDTIARGKYLVENVALCVDCHGPDLGGKLVEESFPMGRLASANLTRGAGGLPPDYSDEDILRVLTHGVKRDGRSVIFMPSADYRFTAADAAAVIAYVRSVPPVDRAVPPIAVGPVARALGLFTPFPLATAATIDHSENRLAAPPDMSSSVKKGDYLVSTAGCRGCHGALMTGGGGPPPGASNITPAGIGDWTEQDFVTAIRTHRRPDGSAVDEAMPLSYGQMSDEDLKNIYAYLRTVPAAGEKTERQRSAVPRQAR
jgi:mono/diheme cytochrome c family protein